MTGIMQSIDGVFGRKPTAYEPSRTLRLLTTAATAWGHDGGG
jgi:hypothetical protein